MTSMNMLQGLHVFNIAFRRGVLMGGELSFRTERRGLHPLACRRTSAGLGPMCAPWFLHGALDALRRNLRSCRAIQMGVMCHVP